MPRHPTRRHILFVVASCVAVIAMAANRTERVATPATRVATTGGIDLVAQFGNPAISLSWR